MGRKNQMWLRLPLFFSLLLLVGACANEEPVVAPTRAQVVDAYVESGLSEEIAACVVGIGERQFNLAELHPGLDTPPATQDLVDEFVLSCANASELGETDWDEPAALAFAGEPDVFGDDPELDDLWLLCEAGAGSACDELWESAPIGSSYEKFGVTCGERFDVLDCTVELPLEVSELDIDELRPVEEPLEDDPDQADEGS